MGNRGGKSNRALGPTGGMPGPDGRGTGEVAADPAGVIRQYERGRAERNRAGH